MEIFVAGTIPPSTPARLPFRSRFVMFNLPNQHRNNRKQGKLRIFRIAPTYSLALSGPVPPGVSPTNIFFQVTIARTQKYCAVLSEYCLRSRFVVSETNLDIQYPGTTRSKSSVVVMPHRKQTRRDLLLQLTVLVAAVSAIPVRHDPNSISRLYHLQTKL
jgi:hypothetical protein